jgi:hypothetical protein
MRDSLAAAQPPEAKDFFVETPEYGGIFDAISDMKMKYQDQPDMLSRLSELEDTYRSIPHYPEFVHIPSLRQYLQDLRSLIHTLPNFANKYVSDLDDAISDISHLEMTINRQLQPNLGQALSYDLKGSDVLTKFTRYESQTQRGLFKAIHELQRLQATRHGADRSSQIAAPVAIDVDISGEYAP